MIEIIQFIVMIVAAVFALGLLIAILTETRGPF